MIKPDATDQEADHIMRSEGGREALYQQQILSGGINDQIKTQYRAVAGKYQDVLALEASVAELHQMFLDFALLTEQQGELLDQIEYQVRSAADYVEEGNIEVYEAIEYQKKIRKKQCWIILIVVILIIIVLFSMGVLPLLVNSLEISFVRVCHAVRSLLIEQRKKVEEIQGREWR